ncbi:MAG: phosphoribosylformylglycinamidine cyclo-ligase [Candidatus Omnitrophica bacterium]|nr:phosphoribosylformylglycinamidine cyclo-ligase [Candidatus Omnitrophota bacterium]
MNRITYRQAGVDINKANKLIDTIKPLVAMTKRDGWVGNIGAFSGLFDARVKRFKEPYLVASTDGVGTKCLIAQWVNKHDTIGIDLVAMNVNDLVTCGAEPLFFLDYFATGALKPAVMRDVIKGIVRGCQMANVSLIGGETAELPGMYAPGVYDIAGFTVGIVDKKDVIDGSKVREGDFILGIQSSGIHSNGYSMVRKILTKKEITGPYRKEILEPTIIYVKPVLDLIQRIHIKGIANITGGGFFDNIIRILPDSTAGIITKGAWRVPRIFDIMQRRGKIKDREMFWTFNMGIGMVMIVSKKDAWAAKRILKDKYSLDSWIVGEVIKGSKRIELIES